MQLLSLLPFLSSALAASVPSIFGFKTCIKALENSIDNNNIFAVDNLIKSGIPVDVPLNHEGLTPLMLAAELGRIEIFDYLINAGASINKVNSFGYSALLLTCSRFGTIEGLRACLKVPNVNIHQAETEQFNTPLHLAAVNGHLENVEALIEAGSQIESENSIGNTPLLAACYKDNHEVVKILVSRGADYLHVNRNGKDALAIASSKNSLKIAKFLLYLINPGKKNYNTGIMRALSYCDHGNDLEMSELLRSYFPGTFSFVDRKPDSNNI